MAMAEWQTNQMNIKDISAPCHEAKMNVRALFLRSGGRDSRLEM
jgi:hypothetical protein